MDKQNKIWFMTDLDKYFMLSNLNLTEEEKMEVDLYLIEKYYPGTANLRDDELAVEKLFSSKHSFQYLVSVKRMIELSAEGIVIKNSDWWRFGFGGRL